MAIKLRTIIKFPAQVIASSGLGVSIANRVYTFKQRWSDFAVSLATPDLSTSEIPFIQRGATSDADVYGTVALNTLFGGTTIANNAVTNAKLAQAPAYTIKGNATGSLANVSDIDITALTLKAVPAASDVVLIQDSAASFAMKKTTASALTAVGSVATLNGATGAIALYFPPQGRLTLTSALPVMTSTVSAATTVFYTPHVGNMVPIYDGTNMVPTVFSELSQATTDATKSPAAVAASKIYDVFVWNDAGTIRATRGPAWTNDTTRGYTLTQTRGILLNTSIITNGPAALRGTWVGTIGSNAGSTVDFIFGANSSGGTAAVLNVWNAYNRVVVTTQVTDGGVSYTYSAITTRQARGSAGNQITFVSGAAYDGIWAYYSTQTNLTANIGSLGQWGIGLDTTSSYSGQPTTFASPAAAVSSVGGSSPLMISPQLGRHIISANENSDGTHSQTFDASGIAVLGASLMM